MPVVFYLNYSKILIEIIADDSAIFLSKRYSFEMCCGGMMILRKNGEFSPTIFSVATLLVLQCSVHMQ